MSETTTSLETTTSIEMTPSPKIIQNNKKMMLYLFFTSKMGRILLFLFIFYIVIKIINYILDFFNIGKELGYIYFIWFSILFLFFTILPLKKSFL